MNPEILSTERTVFYFPVRHHSPAAALLIEDYIRQTKPAAVLVEGPSDFNLQLSQLALPHELPIAIYSYTRLTDGRVTGVFYPFCDYSPEWRALQAAKDVGVPAAFIDMPWSQLHSPASRKNRYSDAPLLRSDYIGALCKKFGVEDFNDLWDTLFEIDHDLTLAEYLKRCHHLCYCMRLADGAEHEDIMREEYMAKEIKRAMDALEGQIVVVTGGFHSYALFARLNELDHELPGMKCERVKGSTKQSQLQSRDSQRPVGDQPREEIESDNLISAEDQLASQNPPPADPKFADNLLLEQNNPLTSGEQPEKQNRFSAQKQQQESTTSPREHGSSPSKEEEEVPPLPDWQFVDAIRGSDMNQVEGISLTPYSYPRLDALIGYEAGMPGPGFYHEVYFDRACGQKDTYRKILFAAVESLRARKQQINSADIIAVETSAAGLAALRGHTNIWRKDLLDAIVGALLKDEQTSGLYHPLQQAVDQVLRGEKTGRLADGTVLPSLVTNIKEVLQARDLLPPAEPGKSRELDLDLSLEEQRVRSCILHRIRCLDIPGFELLDGGSSLMNDETGKVIESWTLTRHEYFEACCIEAAVYGSSLADASAVRLVEKSSSLEHNTEVAAMLLLESCLMGFSVLGADFCHYLRQCIDQDADLYRMSSALRHLLFLFRYDTVLSDKPLQRIGEMVLVCFERCVWLLDSTGAAEQEIGLILQSILEAFERTEAILHLDRNYFVEVLNRIRADQNRDALLRGAATGALWTLNEAPPESITGGMSMFAKPELLGNFLTGLFLLAKEASKHRSDLILKIDEMLMHFNTEEFLEALPHLRLAFTVFSPKEKDRIAQLILTETGDASAVVANVDLDIARNTMLVQSKLNETLKRYGLRGYDE